jgi:predicted ester cyclase
MTRPEIEALLARHQENFRRRDIAALAMDHAPNGVFESPAHGRVAGRSAIEDMYRYWFEAFPDMTLEWAEPIIDGTRAALFWEFTGTLRGRFFGEGVEGSRIRMVGAAEYHATPEGFSLTHHRFDFSGVLIKSGALKTKPA